MRSNLPGESQTLTLLVNDRYNRGAEYGAYALSTLLMGVAVVFLIVKTILLIRRKRAKARPDHNARTAGLRLTLATLAAQR